MRLLNTLQEAAEYQMIVKDIEPKMHELYRILKKNNFQMSDESLEKTLDAIFKDKGIGFTKGTKSGENFSKTIQSGGITEDLFIVLNYPPGFSKFFKRFAKPKGYENFFSIKKNEFFRSLAEVVSHEYRHLFQTIASKHKTMDKDTVPDRTDLGYKNYLKNPHELDAFALTAAIQNITIGQSSVLGQYHHYFKDDDPKIWKKFLKKSNAHVKDLKKRGLVKYIKLK